MARLMTQDYQSSPGSCLSFGRFNSNSGYNLQGQLLRAALGEAAIAEFGTVFSSSLESFPGLEESAEMPRPVSRWHSESLTRTWTD